MRCRVCGSNNEDGSKFCWNCGNKLTEQSETRSSSVNQPGIQQNSGDVQHNQVGTPPKQVRMPQRQVPPGGFDWENGKKMAEERLQKGKNIADGCVGQLKRVAENQTITDKLKKISKKTWGIIGACVALVLVLLIVIALHKPTVNLNDYLKVTYGGYDGGGVAYTEIDWNSMKEDFENKISYKRGMAQTGGMTPIDIIMEYTNANIEGKNEKLSNGDKVSYTWKVDKDAIAKLIKCKIKYSDGSKKVSGLKEMELFDPFKNLKVTFSGVEPNGEADIEYNGDMLSEYDFTCDKTSGLKNGDKIKISLTEDAGYYVDQYNKAPSVLEKEYKVKNLGKYLSKIKEVDTDGMNSARAKAQKSISDMVDYWSEDVTLDKVSYAGDYLQVAKDSDDYTKNYYGVIYQINAHIQPDGGQRKDVVSYYSMKFENVIVGGDGKCEIDLDEYDVPYDDFSVEVTSGDLSSGSYPGHSAVVATGTEPLGPGSSEQKAADASGTRGISSGVPEYELTLNISVQLKEVLEQRGYQVVLTRESNNVPISCVQRAEVANNLNADVYVRIHANGSENSNAKGAMTICTTPNNPYNASIYGESKALSEAILDKYCEVTGCNKEYVWETDTMSGNNWSQVPVTIVEMGYMTNPEEDVLMQTAEYQQKMVQGIADGIDAYMENY